LKKLVAFAHDISGNVGNLSRIDPSLLGVKDRNVLYLHSDSPVPLLCFSLVLVTRDNHEHGRIFGTDPKEYVMKDIVGVLHAMELERFVAVIGLAYKLPYIPEDSARREGDILHFAMVDNGFSFTTLMLKKNGEHFYFLFFLLFSSPYRCLTTDFEKEVDAARYSKSSKSTPKRANNPRVFAPASPSFASKVAVLPFMACKTSIRASETGKVIL
jgi:hypothetical protein